MRYSYEIFKDTYSGLPVRVDTGIRVELVKLKPGERIIIVDNLYPNKTPVALTSQDALDEWCEAIARQQQWQDAATREAQRIALQSRVLETDAGDKIENTVSTMVKQPYDALEETDGFHVKRTKAGHAPHMTLGDLKMERPLEDANVKTAAAVKKPRMAAVPPIAIMALGTAMQTGADKYGLFNWRDTNVTATVFYNAMLRHLEQWYSGEQHASDTGVHHLAHLMAGAAIILDAEMNNVFIDDRPKGEILGDDYAKHFMKASK